MPESPPPGQCSSSQLNIQWKDMFLYDSILNDQSFVREHDGGDYKTKDFIIAAVHVYSTQTLFFAA